MTTAEIFKLRTQRTPLVCALALLVGSLIPSAVLIFYTPSNTDAYSSAFEITFGILSVLLAIVFGGWLLGSEYRQGTVKRMLTSEPRRTRALVTKGVVGAVAMSIVLAVASVVGWGAARYVGSINDVTVPWDGRELLAGGVIALLSATVAYGLSAITRSDSFAMVGTVAVLLVIDPLLSLVPTFGKYRFGAALDGISASITGQADTTLDALSLGTASLTMAAWIGTVVFGGVALFRSRDV